MWALWDRIKKGLDAQEKARKKKQGFGDWINRAQPLWDFLSDTDTAVRYANPVRCSISYGYWLSARRLEGWLPGTTGPFLWIPPGIGRAGETERLAAIAEKHEAFKEGLKKAQKEKLKEYRAEQRAIAKQAKKEGKNAPVRSSNDQ